MVAVFWLLRVRKKITLQSIARPNGLLAGRAFRFRLGAISQIAGYFEKLPKQFFELPYSENCRLQA